MLFGTLLLPEWTDGGMLEEWRRNERQNRGGSGRAYQEDPGYG